MEPATGVSWGYLLPKREPERKLTHVSDVFTRILAHLTVVEIRRPALLQSMLSQSVSSRNWAA